MRDIKKNSLYRHFKGDLYLVIDTALNSETEEEMVLYRGLYKDCRLFVKPKDMFLSEIDPDKYPDVKQKYRFEEVEIESVNRDRR